MKKTLQTIAFLLCFIVLNHPAIAADDEATNDTPGTTPAHDAALPPTIIHEAEAPEAATAEETPAAETPAPDAKPARAAHSNDDYTIIPGDVLQITVWKEEELNQEVLVLNDGTINFPLIGSIPAQGSTTGELQDTIKAKLSKLIPDASVTVAVKAALGHTVNVIGQVAKPGELVMGHNLTVMQALSQAGGLTPYADDGRIIILHRENGKETSIRFPYSDVIRGDELDKDIVLSPGDVVVVPTAGLL